MKKVFIVNPMSGQGRALEIIKYIESKCKENHENYEIIYTSFKNEASSIAKNYNNCIIYAVGGDGTINEVVNGMAYSNSLLHVIPAGSGNDFYKTISKCKEGIMDIDLGKVNDKYFVNSASIGIDSEISNNASLMKKLNIPKSQIYNASIIYTFLKYKPYLLNVENKEMLYSLLTITNGKYYGGGFKITPDADLSDGYLNLCSLDNVKKIELISFLLNVIKGEHYGKKHVHNSKIKNLKVTSNVEILCGVDGECIRSNEFNFKVCPNAIRYYNHDDYDIKRLIVSK